MTNPFLDPPDQTYHPTGFATGHPDGQPEDVDAARERVHERIERLQDPFLGAAVDEEEEF